MGETEHILRWYFLLGGTGVVFLLLSSLFIVLLITRNRIKAEQKFTEQIIDSTSALILIFKVDGTILEKNRAILDFIQNSTGSPNPVNVYDWLQIPSDKIESLRNFKNVRLETSLSIAPDDRGDEIRYIDWKFNPFQVDGKPVLIIGTGIDVTQRKRITRELEIKEKNLSKLSTQLIQAQEEERGRIAKELHDEQGQALTAIQINLKELQYDIEDGDADQIAYRLEDSKQMVEASLSQIRSLSHELRPTLLDDIGLVAAIRWFLNQLSRRMSIKIEFKVTGDETRLTSDIEIVIYRVVQEASTNITKHAQTSTASVTINFQKQKITIAIRDDGMGFDWDPSDVDLQNAGIGLIGMQERIKLVNGSFFVDSKRGKGTTIMFTIPYGGTNG